MKFYSLILASLIAHSAWGTALVIKGESNYTIKSRLIFYGNEATDLLAKKITAEINRHWNIDPMIKFEVTYQLMETNKALEEVKWSADPQDNYIRLEKSSPDNVSFFHSNSGFFLLKDDLGRSTTAAHEFGHSLGLDHPAEDLTGKGLPGMMAPRGTRVDAKYRLKGGRTIDVYKRVVSKEDLKNLKLDDLKFINSEAQLSGLDNTGYDEKGKPISII